jgi:hypothetical protein
MRLKPDKRKRTSHIRCTSTYIYIFHSVEPSHQRVGMLNLARNPAVPKVCLIPGGEG